MRRCASWLLVILVSANAQAEPPQLEKQIAEQHAKPVSVWMERKMQYSQELLRGLATKDFQKIETNAKQMRLISKVEGFVRGGKEPYRTQLRTFQRVCDNMITQADQENLPGVTLAFNQLTVSCVNCHETIRGQSGQQAAKENQPSLPLQKPIHLGAE